MNQNIYGYCRTCDQCRKIGKLLTQNLAKLVTTLLKKPFQKWGLNLIRLVKLVSKSLGNQYIMVAIDYATKRVEARTLHTNIIAITTKFIFEHILTRFGCPLTIVINQTTHFIDDVIIYLINHFIFKHTNQIVYYP